MRAALSEISWSLRDFQASDRPGAVVSCEEDATFLADVSGKVGEGSSATDKVFILALS